MRCPLDGGRLVEIDRAGVLIDACPDCRGIWLDRGELDKILVRERQLAGADDDDFYREVEGRRPAPRSPFADRDDEPYGYHRRHRRRRGVLEDLLDFD